MRKLLIIASLFMGLSAYSQNELETVDLPIESIGKKHEFGFSLGFYSPYGTLGTMYRPGSGGRFHYSRKRMGGHHFRWGVSLTGMGFAPTQGEVQLTNEGVDYGTLNLGQYKVTAFAGNVSWDYRLCDKVEFTPGFDFGWYGTKIAYQYNDDVSGSGMEMEYIKKTVFGISPRVSFTYKKSERFGITWTTVLHQFSGKKQPGDKVFGGGNATFELPNKAQVFSQSLGIHFRF